MSLPKPVWNVLTAARKWAELRAVCVAASNNGNTSPAAIEKAKNALGVATNALFTAVQEMEIFLRKPPTPKKNPVNWGALLGGIASTARILEQAITNKPQTPVIDTTGEETK